MAYRPLLPMRSDLRMTSLQPLSPRTTPEKAMKTPAIVTKPANSTNPAQTIERR